MVQIVLVALAAQYCLQIQVFPVAQRFLEDPDHPKDQCLLAVLEDLVGLLYPLDPWILVIQVAHLILEALQDLCHLQYLDRHWLQAVLLVPQNPVDQLCPLFLGPLLDLLVQLLHLLLVDL